MREGIVVKQITDYLTWDYWWVLVYDVEQLSETEQCFVPLKSMLALKQEVRKGPYTFRFYSFKLQNTSIKVFMRNLDLLLWHNRDFQISVRKMWVFFFCYSAFH